MSLVENDFVLEWWFWALPAIGVLIISFLACPVGIYVIEFFRSRANQTRPPYGFTIFKWWSNFVGDVCLAISAAINDVYYSRVEVDSSFLTSTWFFVITALSAVVAGWYFITSENKDPNGYGKPGVKKFNWNRAAHIIYFVVMMYVFLSFLRSLVYWEEAGLMALSYLFYIGWLITIIVDGKRWNPIWNNIGNKWGRWEYL